MNKNTQGLRDEYDSAVLCARALREAYVGAEADMKDPLFSAFIEARDASDALFNKLMKELLRG